MTELMDEIAAKRRELGCDEPLTAVLEALLRDAAATWLPLASFGAAAAARYPFRHFDQARFQPDAVRPVYEADERYFDKVVAWLKSSRTADASVRGLVRLAGVKELPSPTMARRLRIVTAEFPRLLRPAATRGLGSNVRDLWQILWGDANGAMAPALAKRLHVKRNAVWVARRKAYDQLSDAVRALASHEALVNALPAAA